MRAFIVVFLLLVIISCGDDDSTNFKNRNLVKYEIYDAFGDRLSLSCDVQRIGSRFVFECTDLNEAASQFAEQTFTVEINNNNLPISRNLTFGGCTEVINYEYDDDNRLSRTSEILNSNAGDQCAFVIALNNSYYYNDLGELTFIERRDIDEDGNVLYTQEDSLKVENENKLLVYDRQSGELRNTYEYDTKQVIPENIKWFLNLDNSVGQTDFLLNKSIDHKSTDPGYSDFTLNYSYIFDENGSISRINTMSSSISDFYVVFKYQ